ncbi:MAG: hypothetical protein ACOY3O_00570 [Thermodesulfobacteriota bacterium]
MAAKAFQETLSLLVEVLPLFFMIQQRRHGQHIQGQSTGFQMLIDGCREVFDKVHCLLIAVSMNLAYAVIDQPGRKDQERQHAQADQPVQENLKRDAPFGDTTDHDVALLSEFFPQSRA